MGSVPSLVTVKCIRERFEFPMMEPTREPRGESVEGSYYVLIKALILLHVLNRDDLRGVDGPHDSRFGHAHWDRHEATLL